MRFPITIELRRSAFLSLGLALFHAVAVVCVSILPWPLWARSTMFGLASLSLWNSLRPNKVIALRLCAHDRLEGVLLSGQRDVLGIVLHDTTVFAWVIVLRFRVGEERRVRTLTVLPDQVSPGQFRILRQWLRWRAEAKPAAV